ncbi:membrane protein [Streptomyces lucensis JCM 4490]|uniref:Membrane protein n=1 Tax=Streptomyces lucensis JCM 4490 TaxID=1306176 RepID=A0A918MLK2_9ACTN|nr:peptidoglycan-binding protein [Streptomyces lucensis]GGW36149.1 membrane protein [Streptomyces lucensis JCM 4490]
MTTPAFEDFVPASDCDCPGCVQGRRLGPRPSPRRFGGHPAGRGIVIVAAASAALGAVPPAASAAPGQSPHRQADPGDDGPATPQGAKSPLHGTAAKPGTVPIPATTRTAIINRAKLWVAAKVPYSMTAYWSDGYRQDCSGYVSMAWGLPGNEWTGSLGEFGTKITKEELQPGDILLYHNPDNPESGSHVVIFGGWTDYTHTYYTVYEQTPPHTRTQTTPYPYWNHTDKYVPYRYKGVPAAVADPRAARKAAGAAGPAPHAVPGYPGRGFFRPGAVNDHVTRLGAQLVRRGFGRYYATGPGPRWGEADRRAVEAFQRTQGWRGGAADGYPGPETWRRLFA